jgi:hypothetical protein
MWKTEQIFFGQCSPPQAAKKRHILCLDMCQKRMATDGTSAADG